MICSPAPGGWARRLEHIRRHGHRWAVESAESTPRKRNGKHTGRTTGEPPVRKCWGLKSYQPAVQPARRSEGRYENPSSKGGRAGPKLHIDRTAFLLLVVNRRGNGSDLASFYPPGNPRRGP